VTGRSVISTAEFLVDAARAYGMAGLAVAIAFLVLGLARVDPSARDAVSFRALLLPGLVLLWPLVAWRWYRLEQRLKADEPSKTPAPDLVAPPAQRRVHGRVWAALVVLLPLGVLALIALRQTVPADAPAVLLEPPAEAAPTEAAQ